MTVCAVVNGYSKRVVVVTDESVESTLAHA